jgi:hypothetical protein
MNDILYHIYIYISIHSLLSIYYVSNEILIVFVYLSNCSTLLTLYLQLSLETVSDTRFGNLNIWHDGPF